MEEKNIIREFLSGGWLVPLIGALGMVARMLTYRGKYSINTFLKNVVSATLLSAIAWFILRDAPMSDFIKAICYGVVGVVSPEIINGVIALAKKFEKNPEKFIKK